MSSVETNERLVNTKSILYRSAPGAWKFEASCAGSNSEVSCVYTTTDSPTSKPILVLDVVLYFERAIVCFEFLMKNPS